MRRPWHLTRIGSASVLLEPSEGLDPSAAPDYIEDLVRVLLSGESRYLYYDVKDVAVIDPVYYQWLLQLERSCRLLGLSLVVLHMRPETAFALGRQLNGPAPFSSAQGLDTPPV